MVEERDIVVHEVGAWNRRPLRLASKRVRLVRWPEDIAGGAGAYLQAVINKQTRVYDIFVGLIGARLGSPTPRANSGTEEEFDRAIESTFFNVPVQVLMFFSNRPRPLSTIDPQQFLMVHGFRKKCHRLGVLAHSFDDLSQFRTLFRSNLAAAYKSAVAAIAPAAPEQGLPPADAVTVALPDATLRKKITNPQWADLQVVPLAEHRRKHVMLSGQFRTQCDYFRFGFKYCDASEPVFGPGSVQTFGQNTLIHIGKNNNNPTWFVSPYQSGLRLANDAPQPALDTSAPVRFEFDIKPAGTITLRLNGDAVFETYLQLDGIPCLYLLSWGDEHDYGCEAYDMKLTVSEG
jgi:hypothetical protein